MKFGSRRRAHTKRANRSDLSIARFALKTAPGWLCRATWPCTKITLVRLVQLTVYAVSLSILCMDLVMYFVSISLCWFFMLDGRKSIWPIKTWWGAGMLSVWSEVQMTCVWSSWYYCHPIISASEKSRTVYPSGTGSLRLSWRKTLVNTSAERPNDVANGLTAC